MSKRKSSKRGNRSARAEASAPTQQGDERLVEAIDPGAGRTEIWVRCGELIFLCLAGMVFYLGLRPGGLGPIYVYRYGQTLLGLAALLVLIWGAIACFRRPPLRRKGRIRALIAVVLVIGIGSSPFPYPSSREHRPSAVRFELPVEGEWRVYWGGDQREVNRYAGWFADRRWGMALVRELEGSTHTGSGSLPEDYHAHGQTVLAPAAGLVVALVDGQPDRAPGQRGTAEEPFGNHLVLEVAPGEYVFMCHLLAGSFEVAVLDKVEAGQPLARVGNSGLSTVVDQPHLALHLQTTPREGLGEAIPWSFRDYSVGDRAVESGLPRGGVGTDGRLRGELVRRTRP